MEQEHNYNKSEVITKKTILFYFFNFIDKEFAKHNIQHISEECYEILYNYVLFVLT